MADGYFSALDDALASPRLPGPGDSNYESTFTIRDAEGESGPDWDAETQEIEAEAPSSDEIPALATAGPERWHHRFIETFGFGLIVVALVLIALAVPTIGYLLWRTLGSEAPPSSPGPAVIAGFACAVGLLMISVPLILLAASHSELVRDVRRRDQHGEHAGLLGRR
jgi:hypothetical protein